MRRYSAPRPLQGRADKFSVQRMRPVGPRPVLPVKLRAHEPGMVRQFDDLDQVLGRVDAGHAQAVPRQRVQVGVVDLVAVPVAFGST